MFKCINGAYPRNYIGGGKAIPADSDLKSEEYVQPGMYRANTQAIAQSLTNCPASKVFIMHVERITEETNDWVYIHREIVEAAGTGFIYHQYVSKRISTGAIAFYDWHQVSMTKVT